MRVEIPRRRRKHLLELRERFRRQAFPQQCDAQMIARLEVGRVDPHSLLPMPHGVVELLPVEEGQRKIPVHFAVEGVRFERLFPMDNGFVQASGARFS